MQIGVAIAIGFGPYIDGGYIPPPGNQLQLISGADFFLISGAVFDLI